MQLAPIAPPQSESELLTRVRALQGLTISELTQHAKLSLPLTSTHAKGFIGQLLEHFLGATSGSRPEPDFPTLNIELKTIPVNKHNKPLESTYITTAPLINFSGLTWETSTVYHKLQCILWVPIMTEKRLKVGARRIGQAFIWRPSAEQAQILQQDWEELTDMIQLGELEMITAHHGTYLQIRPKAANAKALCWGLNTLGEKILTLPRGFYLRSKFTQTLLP